MDSMKEFIEYSQKLKLLYVEDDEYARESSVLIFEEFFEEIVVAFDGEDGLEKFQEDNFDLVIADISMPKMNGLEMIDKIKSLNTKIPTIILSAHMKPEYFLKSIKLGVDGYLIKPFVLDDLLKIFNEIFLNIKSQDEIEKNHNFLQSIIDNSDESIIIVKEDYSVELMNNSVRKEIDTNYISDINNPKCYEISHHRSTPCDNSERYCPLKDVIQSKKSKNFIHLKDGQIYMEITAKPVFDKNQNCIGMTKISKDITKYIEKQKHLLEQKDLLSFKANHDILTGLANRELFHDRLKQAIISAKRNKTKLALFFIDLDKFKQINDTKGHKAGDFVLQHISKNMQKEVREKDTLARIGGDEFTLIMEDINGLENIQLLAKKIIEVIKKPINWQNEMLTLSASIGISIYPDDSSDSHKLLEYADMAMYKAKKSSTNIVSYSASIKALTPSIKS